jgi:hypothetical protein
MCKKFSDDEMFTNKWCTKRVFEQLELSVMFPLTVCFTFPPDTE